MGDEEGAGEGMSVTGEHQSVLSKNLTPCSVVRWRNDADTIDVLAFRKDDDSGWWLVGGGGLADSALDGGEWNVLYQAPLVVENDASECEACGVNTVEGCAYHRGWERGYMDSTRHFVAVITAAAVHVEKWGAPAVFGGSNQT